MFRSRYMPCEECGASVDRHDPSGHRCSPGRRADYEVFGLRHEVAQLEAKIEHFLTSATGRFESWLAARHVRGKP